jgi:hypothetical protein
VCRSVEDDERIAGDVQASRQRGGEQVASSPIAGVAFSASEMPVASASWPSWARWKDAVWVTVFQRCSNVWAPWLSIPYLVCSRSYSWIRTPMPVLAFLPNASTSNAPARLPE